MMGLPLEANDRKREEKEKRRKKNSWERGHPPFICKEISISAKETSISAKEMSISAKEPYTGN